MEHIPVLLEDVVAKVKDTDLRSGVFIDATFGRGGHTRALLAACPHFSFLGVDCDDDAIKAGEFGFKNELSSGRLKLLKMNFSDLSTATLREVLSDRLIAGVLLDLGVSSPQLDQGHRGFSFYHDGPLDMRMDQAQEFKASDIVNTWDEKGLIEVFQKYGEIRHPYRVVERILTKRKSQEFKTTGELAHLIESAEGWRKKGHHPATNYFMALRIEVNQELARIEKALPALLNMIAPKGRLLVITFHSLEDRLVKETMKSFEEKGLGHFVNRKVIQADWNAKKLNPRARSAKLRVFERG